MNWDYSERDRATLEREGGREEMEREKEREREREREHKPEYKLLPQIYE